jgi:hypothetical protein
MQVHADKATLLPGSGTGAALEELRMQWIHAAVSCEETVSGLINKATTAPPAAASGAAFEELRMQWIRTAVEFEKSLSGLIECKQFALLGSSVFPASLHVRQCRNEYLEELHASIATSNFLNSSAVENFSCRLLSILRCFAHNVDIYQCSTPTDQSKITTHIF